MNMRWLDSSTAGRREVSGKLPLDSTLFCSATWFDPMVGIQWSFSWVLIFPEVTGDINTRKGDYSEFLSLTILESVTLAMQKEKPFVKLFFNLLILLGVNACSIPGRSGPPAIYWPNVVCPEHNEQDPDDVCLIKHGHQTDNYATNLKAYSSDVTRDGKWIACGGRLYIDGFMPEPVLFVNFSTGEITELQGSFGTVQAVVFSPDGKWVAATGARSEKDAFVSVWDTQTGERVSELSEPAYQKRAPVHPFYSSVIFSPDGKWILAGHSYGHVVVWDVATGNIVKVLQPPRLWDGPDKLRAYPNNPFLVHFLSREEGYSDRHLV